MNFQSFKNQFFNGNTDKKDFFKRSKAFFLDFESILNFSNNVEIELRAFKTLYTQVLLGKNPFPKYYSELYNDNKQYYTESLAQEMNWQVLAFLKCSEPICKFIKLRNVFEHNLLIGNYEQARLILDTIEKDICISFWSLEHRFILDEYQFGHEKNWETNRNINSDKTNAQFVKVFSSMYSVKAEHRVSFFQYNEEFSSWEAEIGNKHVKLSEYFRFKGNYFSISKYNHLAGILFYESQASIIDRYLLFIRISQHVIIEPSPTDNNLKFLLKKLNDSIDDICIEQMLISLDTSYTYKNIHYTSSIEVMNIIDEYTKGDYQKCKSLLKFYLKENNGNYAELCELYAKCLVELKCDYENITETFGIIDKISKIYYDILSKVVLTDNALVDLVKLAYTFNSSHIGLQLYAFLKIELGWKTEIDYSFLSRLNSKFINPNLISSFYKNREIAQSLINNLVKVYPESVTANLFRDFYQSYLINQTRDFSKIPYVKNIIYQLRSALLNSKYSESITKYSALLQYDSLSIITQYEVVTNLFFCYLQCQDFRNCVRLFTTNYLKNVHLIRRMNMNSVIDNVIKGKFKNIGEINTLIELPICFKILCSDKIKVKQSYELFLKSNSCTKPNEIISIKDKFEDCKLIYFLRYVCIPEIMQLSTEFESTEKVNVERITICQFLTQYDEANSSIYRSEIVNLTQRNMVSKVIAKIDEGKIYVNEDKIKQLFLLNSTKRDVLNLQKISDSENNYLTKDFFDRTLDLKSFTENNKFKKVDTIVYINVDEKGELKSKNNPAFDDFKKMFLEIRNHFLANREYGLDSYLSTRIRHGTLINHIRSVFEQYNLITSQVDGEYTSNEYWERIGFRQSDLNRILSDFSKKIDSLLSELKEELIQYKTEQKTDKSKALFNYAYENDTEILMLYLSKIESFEEFVELAFLELRKKTDRILESIQRQLNTDVKEQFVKLLTDTEHDLLNLGNKQLFTELLNNINLCRTDIQNKLNYISKWFSLSESSFDGKYELRILAETSVQITKHIHPNYNFNLEISLRESLNIKGEFHQHFIDLMNNFLFNIIKHSELTCEEVNAKLIISEVEDTLYLTFQNCVADVSKHNLKLINIKNNWRFPDSNVSQEEGSGFPKIKKIIHSDLGRKSTEFNFSFNG
ncbi:MAG: hypothetical protein QE277_11115, partial [Flectobacillus sp.]|nr:hypothetical protein [Flectobacillus sp.]